MTLGLLGKKMGMSQVFDKDGTAVPVTLIKAGPCPIVQIKVKTQDGYSALQLGFEPRPARSVNRPLQGHCKKASVDPVRFLREVRVENPEGYEVGQILDVDIFKEGDKVDVTGYSKGRGFAGSMKRHHSKGGPSGHGSMYHRGPGSMGGSSYPSRVFKGKKLPGHMGNSRCTAQNLTVVMADKERNLLIVKGSVPGHSNGLLMIRKSVKQRNNRK